MMTMPDMTYKHTDSGELMLDAYLPEQKGFSVIIWFHGGGLETGDRKRCKDMAAYTVERGYGLVSVEYRMYPRARYPDYIEDAADSIAFVLKRCEQWGANGKVFIAGRSAGAYLTMMLCMNHAYLRAAGVEQEQIMAYITDSAQQFCHFNVLREMGIDARLERINDRAPIYYVAESLHIRPLLMMYYAEDIVCRPEETKLMYASIRSVMADSDAQILELPGTHCCDIGIEFEKICDFADHVMHI